MKNNDYKTLVLRIIKGMIIILIMSCTISTNAATKYGLIVAVGSQPADTKWKSNSAANDAKVMAQSLRNKGFDSIIVLVDQAATKQAILGAIEKAILTLKKGDIFLFHFSGNGQKLLDDNADEIDGLDEALVTYGAPSKYDRWYKFDKHIRDDEFAEVMDRMRAKLGAGGEILVVIDAGFGYKNSGQKDSIRGGVAAMVPEDYQYKSNYIDINAGIYEDRPFGMPADNFAPIVCISASLSHLVSFEHNGNGVLTLAFDRAMEKAQKGDTYEQLFSSINKIIKEMGIQQYPAIDGFYDREIFDFSNAKSAQSTFTEEELKIDERVLQALLDREEFEIKQFLMEQDPKIKSLF